MITYIYISISFCLINSIMIFYHLMANKYPWFVTRTVQTDVVSLIINVIVLFWGIKLVCP